MPKISWHIILKIISVIVVSIFLIILLTTKISFSSLVLTETNLKKEFFRPVIEELLLRGADSSFVDSLISDPSVSFDEKYVRISVTGYLKKTDYTHNYNKNSLSKCKLFLKKNLGLLEKVEKQYNVPKEIITAILWVETRFGEYLGRHHVVSVLMSMAMSDNIDYLDKNLNKMKKSAYYRDMQDSIIEEKLKQRTDRKHNLAISELLALQEVRKKLPQSIFKLRGSWSAAFGMPQFLPSSYLTWGIDGNHDGVVDLFNLEDAVYSVANYLNKHGCGDSENLQHDAVYSYNNSEDYTEAVLILSFKLKNSEN